MNAGKNVGSPALEVGGVHVTGELLAWFCFGGLLDSHLALHAVLRIVRCGSEKLERMLSPGVGLAPDFDDLKSALVVTARTDLAVKMEDRVGVEIEPTACRADCAANVVTAPAGAPRTRASSDRVSSIGVPYPNGV